MTMTMTMTEKEEKLTSAINIAKQAVTTLKEARLARERAMRNFVLAEDRLRDCEEKCAACLRECIHE